jgi:valyl-tRNA synthetase
VCDNDTDGYAIFDLRTRDAEVLGTMNPADYTVTYHTQEIYAQAGTPAIPNPAAYSSQSGTIWVRVTENATGCYDIVALELIVNPLPVAIDPTPYTLCDINNPGDEREAFDLTTKIAEITGGAFGVTAGFYHTYADAQAGTNAIADADTVAYTNTATVETLFVRVTNDVTGCYRIVLLDLRVEPLPIVDIAGVDPDDITECDPDGNGYAQFDLQALIQGLINNGQNLVVSFHETAQDAQNNLNPIANPQTYTNINPFTHTIYIRVENTASGCVNSQDIPLTLTVVGSPQVPELEDIEVCDDTDNNNQDWRARVDLTQQDAVIEAAIGTGYTIHYFTSEAAAQAGSPRIVNPAAFIASNAPAGAPQTIWVRVEDANECFGIESFDIIINRPLALTIPAMYTLCNEALPNDNHTVFDLTSRDNEILGPANIGSGHVVTYYEQDPRVFPAAVAISNPSAYTNLTNAQTLYVMVTTPDGCKSYTTLTIKVLPLPTPRMNPDALELCDYTGLAGEETFDLTLAAQQIRNNDGFALLSYYTSQADAELAQNAIATPTAWTSATATIYVRVEAGDSNPQNPRCAVIVPLDIIVNPLPVVGDGTQIEPYAICEPSTDGFAQFTLNSSDRISDILMTQNPADYSVKFFRSPTDAQSNTNALPNVYTNQTMTHQVIYVRVQNLATECITIMPWDLYVELEAVANGASDLDTCDTDGANDGLHVFDLTIQDATILGGQPQGPGQYIVEYYETNPETDPLATPIANPAAWTNTTADVQRVYVRVYNDGTISKCSDYTFFDVKVNRLPEPHLEGGTICVVFGTNEVLTGHPLNTGLPAPTPGGYQYTWYFNGAVIPGATGESYEVREAGDYTVSVISPEGCTSNPLAPVTVVRSGPASAIGVGYEVTNAFSQDQTITINVTGYGVYEYRLDYGPWQASNIFTDVPRGMHTVYVRDISTDNPCDEDYMILELEDISIIDYPKFFTPNADGHNDTWNITGLGGQLDAKIYIFDRYGKLLKQISSSTESEGWDGTYNGAPLIADDYWFTVTYREMVNGVEVTKEFKAHFSLKR